MSPIRVSPGYTGPSINVTMKLKKSREKVDFQG